MSACGRVRKTQHSWVYPQIRISSPTSTENIRMHLSVSGARGPRLARESTSLTGMSWTLYVPLRRLIVGYYMRRGNVRVNRTLPVQGHSDSEFEGAWISMHTRRSSRHALTPCGSKRLSVWPSDPFDSHFCTSMLTMNVPVQDESQCSTVQTS